MRLVDERGNMVGVVERNEALTMASDAGLDLVEIAPNADPPVCKILDFGKYKYEEQKKKNEARKKQKIIEVKEIKLRPSIDDHDYNTKLNHMREFLAENMKVKVSVFFRGRENAHPEFGQQLMQRVIRDVEGTGHAEVPPKQMGKSIHMMLAPVKGAGKKQQPQPKPAEQTI